MKRTAAIALACALIAPVVALLALPAPALAQGSDPFGPIGPSAPPEQQPAPQPQPTTTSSNDDGGPGLWASVGLAAIAVAAIGGVFVAIVREGRRMDRRRSRRKAKGLRSADSRRRSPAAARTAAAGSAGERRSDGKRPPPPPRKRRAKSKRR